MKRARLLVTIEVEVTGNPAAAKERLEGQSNNPFPMFNGSHYGAGRYDIRCLGVRSVRASGRASGAKGGGR